MKILLGLLLLLAIFAAVTWWKAGVEEARAEAANPPTGQFVTVGDTPVHYVMQGEGPDVVLIHGASGSLRDFTFDLADRLATRYRVIAFDRPGLGYTPALTGDGSIFAQADLLVAAARALGVERPVVVGHSYGGAVALAWITRHPDAASAMVTLGGASNPWETPLSTYYRLLSHPVAGPILANLITAWVPESYVEQAVEGVFTPQTAPEGYARFFGPTMATRRAALLENARQRASILDEVTAMVPSYRAINMPVEILHGDEDTTVWLSIHAEPLSQQVAGANLVVMEGVGHMPHHAEPETVTAAIDRAAARAGLR